MNIPRAAALVALTTVLLAGCAPSAPETTSPPPAAETPSATPTPEPTKPTVEELVLSADGLGPLRIGEQPPVTHPDVDVVIFDPEYCAEDVAAGWITDPGKWVTNYPWGPGEYGKPPFSVNIVDGVLQALFTLDPRVRTAGDIGIGSTVKELLAVYPDAVLTRSELIDLYVIAGESGQLVFEAGNDTSIGYDPGVIWIAHVIPTDVKPYSFANSDAGFGNCVSA
ncbi:hypothetical protein EYE40_03060 [Glaciihabitans arcticus]|uniref:DUF3558 domain-containing protein n=1 Tax=Glaciihabitans arcticus TaxID=2668039 RepID=A0A4Q9GS78_9MICO|nr:hypothetical protein [Glaciihabitans arcticus]TBN56458.1 hypothetical protein EYE40_03060 [Glaciihabitans arcticus]